MKLGLEIDWLKVAEKGITRENVTECLGLAVVHSLMAEGRAERAGADDLIRRIGELSNLLLGKFETIMIGSEICLRAESGFGPLLRAGTAVENILRDAWGKVIPKFMWEGELAWKGGELVTVSGEAALREERADIFCKFGETQASEIAARAGAGDRDAKAALMHLGDSYRTAAARLGLHFLHLGPEEVYRRLGRKYPSGELLDADDAAPVDGGAAVGEAVP